MSGESTRLIKAKVLSSRGFSRAHNRYELELELTAQIVIPEETFKPEVFKGRTQDVSAAGMGIVLENLSQDFFKKLLPKSRYIRLNFNNPISNRAIKITGRIMSIDYHKPKAEEPTGRCFFGIYFDKNEGVDLSDYVRFVEAIRPL